MKRKITFLIAAVGILFFTLFTWPETMCGQTRAEVEYSTCLFGGSHGTSNGYTSTWTATNGNFTWSVSNGNTNGNNWAYVKFGRSGNASIGTVVTSSAYNIAITKVSVTIDAITANKINSIKLYTSSNGTTWGDAVGTFTKSTGTQTVNLASPAKNLYYKIEFDCASGSSNGLISVSEIKFYMDKLSTPTNFTPSAGNAQASFSWDAVTNASSYTLAYKTSDAQVWTEVTGIETTSYTKTELENGTTYNTKVKAVGTGRYTDSDYTSVSNVTPANVTYYNITVTDPITGGSVSASSATAAANATVTLTPTPSAGYGFTSWNVYKTGDANTTVTVTNNHFTMPAYDVTVDATFTPYTVTLEAGSGTVSSTTWNVTLNSGNLPDAELTDCGTWSFAGWSAAETTGGTETPSYVATAYKPTANITLYAVYTKTVGASFNNTAGGNFIIYATVSETNHYATTVSNSKLQSSNDVEDATLFNFVKKEGEGNYAIKSGNKYLCYTNSTNIGLIDDEYIWTIESTGTFGSWRVNSATSGRALIYRASTYSVFGAYSTSSAPNGSEYFDLEIGGSITYYDNTPDCTPMCATPTFSIAAGYYSGTQNVTLSCATDGATIHYTIDGTDPDGNSPTYSSAIEVSSTTTIRAIATKESYLNSEIASATYNIPVTIAEARAITSGNAVYTKGIITYINGSDAYIQDATGAVDVYSYSNTFWNSYNVGDLITVTGTMGTYDDLIEIKSPTVKETISTGNTLPYMVKTIEAINTDNYTDFQCLRVQIEGAKVDNYTSPSGVVKQGANTIDIYKSNLSLAANDKITFNGIVDQYNSELQLVEIGNITQLPAVAYVESLNAFSYVANNGPSASQSFSFSGKNLGANNLTVSVSGDYEMSVDDGNDWSTITSKTYTPTAGAVASTTLYVRLTADLLAGDHNGTITISAGGDEETIALTGNVIASYVFTTDVNPANSGSVYAEDSDQNEVVSGTSITSTTELTVMALAEVGYRFSSWSVSGGGSSVEEENVDITTFTMGAADATLTANFVQTYAITYAAMTNGSVTAAPNPAAKDDEVTLTISPADNYNLATLKVYKTGDELTEITVTDNKFDMPAYGVTVAATFSEKSKYTVTYDANGGTGTLEDDDSPYYEGSTITVLSPGSDIKRSGYVFTHWDTKSDDTGIDYNPDETFEISANTTLYAQWVQVYEVTFDANGIITESIVEVGDEITTLPEPAIIPGGYAFRYWTTDKNDPSNEGKKVSSPYTPTGDITLYAVFGSVEYSNFVKVTSEPADWSGRYLIVYEINTTSGYAFKGSLTTDLADAGNYVGVTISTNTITQTDNLNSNIFHIAKIGQTGKYSVKSASGYYIGRTTNSNGFDKSTSTVYQNSLSYESSNSQIAGSAGPKLQFYNQSGNEQFKYYKSSQQSIALYLQSESLSGYYTSLSAPVANDITITAPIIITNGSILDMGSNTLAISGEGSLTIEDGGQLITSSSVQLTYKKNITSAAKDGGWYTISTPVHTPSNTFLEHESVENLILASESNYDFFYYDEASHKWMNYKKGEFDLNIGQGYLYRNNGAELHFAGYSNQATSYDVDLSYSSTEPNLLGFNLIGNPYPQNITMSDVTVNNGGTLSGGYVLSKDGAWSADVAATIKPAQGFLVQINKTGVTATISKPAGGAKSRSDRDYLKFIVANSQYEDAAFALFEEGYGLNKIDHRNSDVPMLYIPKDRDIFAIATMDENTQSFNLNFKAKTTGKYTLTYEATGELSYLHVIDRLTGEDVDMLLEGEYSFIASPSDNENRFIVNMRYSNNAENSENSIFAYQNGNDIVVNGEGELQIFDVMGRMVGSQRINGVQTINIPLRGVYIFRLNEKTQKIVVE